ncbi:MFS transporter [Pseudonocardia sp. GCM10023141]|uniref:MFS transporter n=1 Tax=Pseudonocardia sp. GCM10023141 TaxID=3252653 RepID=UPI00361EC03B
MTASKDIVSAPARSEKDARRSAIAGFMGTTLEYYDFFIYGSAAALALGPVFFPSADPATGGISALATFGVAYIARPLGGLVFGHFGDRIGRKRTLVLTLLFMGISTLCIGLLPTYEDVGVLAPALLVLLRLLQGLSAGGEASGSATLSTELAPAGRRGFFASFTVAGASAGGGLASLVFVPIAAMPREQLLAWGWRIPFLVSVVVLIVAFFVRTRIAESPDFQKANKAAHHPQLPLVELVRWHRKPLLRVIGGMFYAVSTSIFSVFSVAYVSQNKGLPISVTTILLVITVCKVVQIGTCVFFGWLADRIGRKPVWALCVYGSIPAGFLYFWAISEGSIVLVILGGLLFSCLASNGIWTAAFAEMFPVSVRYSGLAVGSQIGLTLTGFAPAIALALMTPGSYGWVPVMVFVGICSIISGLVVSFGRETANVELEEIDVTRGSRPER